MIRRAKQKITSAYGDRTFNGVKSFHYGVDLASWNIKIWKRQPVIFPEDCEVTGTWEDKYGGGVAYRALHSEYSFKSIHVELNKDIVKGVMFFKDDIIGYSCIPTKFMKANGMLEHEHFEVLFKRKHVNPIEYFDERGVAYE